MRHILLAQPVTAVSFGMLEAASSALLVAPAGFLDASAACGLRAASGTIDLAPVAAAADDDLGSAVMAQEESAGGFHWRFPSRQGAIDRKRPLVKYSPCTPAQHGVGHDIGANFCGSGRCRARSSWRALFTASRTGLSSPPGPLGRIRGKLPQWSARGGGACLQSPFGLLPTRPLPQHRRLSRPQNPDLSRPRTIPRQQPPLRLAANYRQFLTAIDTCNRKYWTAMATPPIPVTTVLISPTAHSRVERGVVIKRNRMVASRAQPATQVANHEQRPGL